MAARGFSSVPLVPPPPPIPKLLENEIVEESCYEKVQADESTVREEIYRHFQSTIADQESHFLAIFSHVEPILQHGPLCGIVALTMAGALLDEQVDPEKILCQARNRKFSKRGEMFSATAMSELSTQVFPNCETIILDARESNKNIKQQVIDHVVDGNAILVPYDADFNHSPALKHGHAAHWAMLHGVACSIGDDERQLLCLDKSTILTPKEIPSRVKDTLKEYLYNQTNITQVFVICHQGKSKRVGIWSLDDLLKSNENLKEVSPKILEAAQHDKGDSLIVFNMTEFLRSKLVVLRKKEK